MDKPAQWALRAAYHLERFAFRRSMPSRAPSADFYDAEYSDSDEYAKHYTESVYYGLWTVIADRLRASPLADLDIVELGCGPGQLAHLLRDNGLRKYRGFDFSEIALERARQRCRSFEFENRDITGLADSDFVGATVVIATEVLEHIEEDLAILASIPWGVRVLASVPDYPAPAHLRIFTSEDQVRARYGPYLDELAVTAVRVNPRGAHIFLMDGIRSPDAG